MAAAKKLYLNKQDKKILGVCAGLADYFEVDVTLVRVIAVLLCFISAGMAILAYFIIAIIIPEKPGHEDTPEAEKV